MTTTTSATATPGSDSRTYKIVWEYCGSSHSQLEIYLDRSSSDDGNPEDGRITELFDAIDASVQPVLSRDAKLSCFVTVEVLVSVVLLVAYFVSRGLDYARYLLWGSLGLDIFLPVALCLRNQNAERALPLMKAVCQQYVYQ